VTAFAFGDFTEQTAQTNSDLFLLDDNYGENRMRFTIGKLTAFLLIMSISQATLFAQDDTNAAKQPVSQQAEKSPLLIEPETPEEVFDAVVLMVDLARLKLARQYMIQLLKSNPNEEAILSMREKHGPVVFLKLSNIKLLQPFSIQLLTKMNATFRKWATDPKRVDTLIAGLNGGPQARETAIIELRNAGPVIVPRLLTVMLQVEGEKRDMILYALTRMENAAVPPLLGSLQSSDDTLKSLVINTLGLIRSRESIPHLWHPAFAKGQPVNVQLAAREALARIFRTPAESIDSVTSYGVISELVRSAKLHYFSQFEWKSAKDGVVDFWIWNETKNTVEMRQMPTNLASLHTGNILAKQALDMSPERDDVQSLFLGLALATEAQAVGWDKPLPTGPGTAHDLALVAGTDLVIRVLSDSIKNGQTATTLACIRVLGQIGTRNELKLRKDHQISLISALNYPDRRVQFAAATTILQLDPTQHFRNAHRVVEILKRALTDSNIQSAVVVDANNDRANKVGGFLQELGYEPVVVSTGRSGFIAASERMDIELVILNANTIRWDLTQTVANLRADARTASLPILVYGPPATKEKIERLAERQGLMKFIAESATTKGFSYQLKPFLAQIKSPPLTAEQRVNYRTLAVAWLSHIANGQRTNVFNLTPAESALMQVVSEPKLSSNVIQTLGAIPTRTAQQRLQEVTVNEQFEIESRETAALQLAFHIQKHGLLLSTDQVRTVSQNWESASDPSLKTALSSVLGSLKPNAKLRSSRLSNFKLAPIPSTAP